jgi:3-mercaptopropionate dioxygenase
MARRRTGTPRKERTVIRPGPRFEAFVRQVEQAHAAPANEPQVLDAVGAAMRSLVAQDDWLPAALARPDPQYYRQYLLHLDPAGRFSVVSFVWGPGQRTPVHDHLAWGVIGMLRGAELTQSYRLVDGRLLPAGDSQRLEPGDVAAVSPTIGDIHRVSNAHADRVSVSIHAYGTDIGRQERHVFDPETGQAKGFVSGYSPVAS